MTAREIYIYNKYSDNSSRDDNEVTYEETMYGNIQNEWLGTPWLGSHNSSYAPT